MTDKKRYALYHFRYGVLLTSPPADGSAFDPAWSLVPVWSKTEVPPGCAAPTFESWAEADMLLSKFFNGIPLTPEIRRAVQLKEVYADGPLNTASPEACANANLPRWDVMEDK